MRLTKIHLALCCTILASLAATATAQVGTGVETSEADLITTGNELVDAEVISLQKDYDDGGKGCDDDCGKGCDHGCGCTCYLFGPDEPWTLMSMLPENECRRWTLDGGRLVPSWLSQRRDPVVG
jgi:hypothetical protein